MADEIDPLLGVNELRLNPETMQAALARYLDEHVFGNNMPPVKVLAVNESTANVVTEFIVRFHFPDEDTPNV